VMPSQRKREEAVSALKASLVQRFGPESRDIVQAEVDGRLATGAGRLAREDIDAIEQSVILAARHRRGAPPSATGLAGRAARGLPQSRSAPQFATPTPGSAGSRPAAPSPPRPTGTPLPPGSGFGAASRQMPGGLRPASSAGSLQSAASSGSRRGGPLRVAVVHPHPALAPTRGTLEERLPQPPYGISIMEGDDDAGSERSRVQVRPKFKVPVRPKVKPMDHWDLLVAFDGFKHQQEDAAYFQAGKAASHAKFKHTLDDQMDEVRAQREHEMANLRAERNNMLAMTEENAKLKAAEYEREEEQKHEMKKITDEMMRGIEQRRTNDQNKKKREEQQMKQWLANEKKRQQDEDRARGEEHERKCKAAQDEMKAALEEAARKKKEREAAEKTYIAEQQRGMDDKEAANKKAVQDRMDGIERNCATLGAEIAGRDAKAEKELLEKIRRVQEKADKDAKEEADRRRNEHNRKTRDMVNSLGEQCKQREEDVAQDKIENMKQAIIFKEEYDKGLAKDHAEAEARKQARSNLDVHLIGQMSDQLQVHPRNFLVTAPTQQTDICYNRMLFEHMHAEGFMPELTSKMLKQGPQRGKKDPFPSVGRYDGPIHEHELQDPEVG